MAAAPANLTAGKALRGSLSLAAILSCLPLAAQTTFTVSGTVEDANTHQPIARVLVETNQTFPAQLTDSSGRFSFAGVTAGQVQVRFRRPGYYEPLTGQLRGTETLNVASDTPPQALLLAPLATLRGQVTVPDGDSPDGPSVDLYAARVVAGWRRWRLDRSTRVRDDGSFFFGALLPGSYLLHAQGSLDPSPYPAERDTRSGYAPVFNTDAHDLSSASVLSLSPDASASASLHLSRVSYYPVTIRVAGEFPGFGAVITGNGFTRWTARYSNRDESFHTELPSGSYTLHVGGGFQRFGGRDASQLAQLPFRVDGGPVSGLTVSLVSEPPLALTTRVEAADAATGPAPRIAYVRFTPLDDPMAPEISAPVEQGDGGDTQPLQADLPGGRYWVDARASGGYVASLSSGGVDLLTQPLTVEPGAAVLMAATLRSDTGSLMVTLPAEASQAACSVGLIPLSATGVEQHQSAGASSVTFSNVPPGDYLVVATADESRFPFREPGILPQLSGTRVTVAPGSAAQATLTTFFTPPPGMAGPQ